MPTPHGQSRASGMRIPTSDIETGASQDAAVPAVTHQVIARLLLGPVEVGERHAEGGGVEDLVGLGREPPAIQSPVQVLRAQVRVGVYGAGRGQRRADHQRRILGGYDRGVCSRGERAVEGRSPDRPRAPAPRNCSIAVCGLAKVPPPAPHSYDANR